MQTDLKKVKKLIDGYAARTNLEDVIVNEMAAAAKAVRRLKQFPVTHVFAEDYLSETGRRLYANFGFFGKDYYGEATNSREETNEEQREIFVVSLKQGLSKAAITNYSDFDLVTPTAKSRITIAFYLVNGESFFLNASGKNCLELLKIHASVLMPRL
jgi:hypothetical protein